MAPTARAHRSNSPFCDEEETSIILEYGALRCALAVRRKFRNFFKKNPRDIPPLNAFKRLIKRFIEKGEVKPQLPGGRPPLSKETVEEVRNFFLPYQQQQVSISTGCGAPACRSSGGAGRPPYRR